VSYSAPVPGSSSDRAYETHRSRAKSDGAFPRRRFRNRDSGYSTKHDRICLICADVGDAAIQRVERVAVAHMMATLG